MTETWQSGSDYHAIREYLDACLCPICGAGPFKVVASHVARGHDISRKELREAAALSARTSISAPEHREARQQIVREQFTSEFGARASASRLAQVMTENKCDREAALRIIAQKSGAAHMKLYRTENESRDKAMIQLVLSHPDMDFKDVAAQFGVTYKTVTRAMEHYQVPFNGHVRRAASRDMAPLAAVARAKRDANAAERRKPLLDDWDASGQTIDDMKKLAAKYDKRLNTLRVFLASHGRYAVDGRKRG